jgi:type II secretory pathway component GspD/PulD (secretin)
MGLGGLIENTTIDGTTKVPYLGSIPLLGSLFKSKSKSVQKRNLVIFITAKIISPDGGTYQDVFHASQLDEMNLTHEEIIGEVMDDDFITVGE